MKINGLLSFFIVIVSLPLSSIAETVLQRLDRNSSHINFDVSSPSVNFDGEFTDFVGEFLLNPSNLENSKFKMAIDLRSAVLPPDQMMQSILLQSLLQNARIERSTFESTSLIAQGKGRYQVVGNYTWRGKTKSTEVPIHILKSSPQLSEIRILLKGGLDPKEVPLGGNGSILGSTEGRLVFKRP